MLDSRYGDFSSIPDLEAQDHATNFDLENKIEFINNEHSNGYKNEKDNKIIRILKE